MTNNYLASNDLYQTGVALFDFISPRSNDNNGWASIEGGEVIRFSSFHELPSNISFISNIDYKSLSEGKYAGIRNLRNNAFLPVILGNEMLNEVSSFSDTPISLLPEKAVALSSIVSRTLRLAQRIWGKDVLNLWNLSSGIREAMNLKYKEEHITYNNGYGKLNALLENAYQKTTFIKQNNWIVNTTPIHVRYNRFYYFKKMMELAVPHGPATLINSAPVQMSIKDVLSLKMPVLVKVVVRNVRPEVADFLGFASSSGKSSKIREWVMWPELELLNKYADVIVTDVIGWEGYSSVLPEQNISSKNLSEFFEDDMLGLSYSAGLIAEAWFNAMVSGVKNKDHDFQNRCNMIYEPRAVWLTSLDRTKCFQLTKQLLNNGFDVSSYGTGQAYSNVRDADERLKIYEFAKENGLSFPI